MFAVQIAAQFSISWFRWVRSPVSKFPNFLLLCCCCAVAVLPTLKELPHAPCMHCTLQPRFYFTSWIKFTLSLTCNSFLPPAAWSLQQPLISSRWGLAHSNRIQSRPYWFSWDVGWSLKIVPWLQILQKKVTSGVAVIFTAAAEGSSLPFILLELPDAAEAVAKLGAEHDVHCVYYICATERTCWPWKKTKDQKF